MKTVEDIQFCELYFHPYRFLLLLYDRHQHVSVPLSLPHAHSLTCIRPFHNSLEYQQHVRHHNPGEITLFASEEKIDDWDQLDDISDHNLYELFIYCKTEDRCRLMNNWNGQRRWKLKRAISIEHLDFRLLLVAAEHIRAFIKEHDKDHDLHDKCVEDLKQIGLAINNYFVTRDTKLSEQARDN